MREAFLDVHGPNKYGQKKGGSGRGVVARNHNASVVGKPKSIDWSNAPKVAPKTITGAHSPGQELPPLAVGCRYPSVSNVSAPDTPPKTWSNIVSATSFGMLVESVDGSGYPTLHSTHCSESDEAADVGHSFSKKDFQNVGIPGMIGRTGLNPRQVQAMATRNTGPDPVMRTGDTADKHNQSRRLNAGQIASVASPIFLNKTKNHHCGDLLMENAKMSMPPLAQCTGGNKRLCRPKRFHRKEAISSTTLEVRAVLEEEEEEVKAISETKDVAGSGHLKMHYAMGKADTTREQYQYAIPGRDTLRESGRFDRSSASPQLRNILPALDNVPMYQNGCDDAKLTPQRSSAILGASHGGETSIGQPPIGTFPQQVISSSRTNAGETSEVQATGNFGGNLLCYWPGVSHYISGFWTSKYSQTTNKLPDMCCRELFGEDGCYIDCVMIGKSSLKTDAEAEWNQLDADDRFIAMNVNKVTPSRAAQWLVDCDCQSEDSSSSDPYMLNWFLSCAQPKLEGEGCLSWTTEDVQHARGNGNSASTGDISALFDEIYLRFLVEEYGPYMGNWIDAVAAVFCPGI